MRYGIIHPNLGTYADPRNVARLARTAEEAGWEGLFTWDHLGFVWGAPSGDPWVLLTAAAMVTKRLRLGTAVTPLPRRRPQVLAQTLATLDVLTQGRMVLGVGLGGVREATRELSAFGERADVRGRAQMVDEALEVITQLWSGDEVRFRGRHYVVDGVALRPLPVQRPRIPIWVGGESEAALRRAARWDGWVIEAADEPPATTMRISPAAFAEKVALIRTHRPGGEPFDIAIGGYTASGDADLVRSYEGAGATWWLESIHDRRGSPEEMLERAAAGPPRAIDP